MTRRCARSPEGERAPSKRPGSRGGNISLVGAIRLGGDPTLYPFDGAVDGDRFIYFLDILKPTLRNGDVIIMDNCRIHKTPAVKDKIESFGVRPLYLPPYSPELNPIEETWSLTKGVFKSSEARTISEYVDVLDLAKKAVTSEKIEAYFKRADSFLIHQSQVQFE